jgi:hypothetical protein
MILGYPWLRNHNPEVNWQMQEVTLSRCPAQCHTCRANVHEERREAAQIHACHMGPLPERVEEEEEEPESVNFGPLLDPGEHLFATISTPTVPTEVIAAATTTAQQLAEKALHSVPVKEKKLIPPYLRDFEDVFAKESFDSLPEQRTWDHVIELEPGEKPSACKVYPLTPSELAQLDEFLRENPSYRAHPSFEIAHGKPSVTHQEEGQNPAPGPGLSRAECHDSEELLPATNYYFGTHRPASGSEILH